MSGGTLPGRNSCLTKARPVRAAFAPRCAGEWEVHFGRLSPPEGGQTRDDLTEFDEWSAQDVALARTAHFGNAEHVGGNVARIDYRASARRDRWRQCVPNSIKRYLTAGGRTGVVRSPHPGRQHRGDEEAFFA